MKKGDIVLVPFPFTDLSSTKKRPALILVSTKQDVTLAFITTKMHWRNDWDMVLRASEKNGLKKDSLLRLAKITTLEKRLIIGKLGHLSIEKLDELDQKLQVLLQL
jgi:mRNA interferase MazF